MDIGSILGILVVILLLAFLVETLVEALVGTPFDKIPALTPYKWTIMYIALGVGVIGAFVYQFDLLAILSKFLNLEPALAPTPYGIALTGLAIGRGSNYLHDLITKFFQTAKPTTS